MRPACRWPLGPRPNIRPRVDAHPWETVYVLDTANWSTQLPALPSGGRTVHVLLVDTNVLRSDVLRRVRLGPFGRMLSAASTGGLRLITPRHVVEEMDGRIRAFAGKADLDPEAAKDVWLREYRPSLSVVDIDDLIDSVAAHPHVAATLARDPDDAPLAALAALLGQTALSEDADLGLLGSGPWLAHVVAATDAVLAENLTWTSAWGGAEVVSGVVQVGRGAYGGLQRAFGPRSAAIVALLLAGVVVGVLLQPRSRDWVSRTAPVQTACKVLRAGADASMAAWLKGSDGEAFLREKALLDDPQVPQVAHLVRYLATSRTPQTLSEISTALGWDEPVTEQALDAHSAFVPADDTRWQLGRLLAPVPPGRTRETRARLGPLLLLSYPPTVPGPLASW